MTLKIMLTGSSHAAAVYSGWKAVQADYPGVEIEMFAFPVYAAQHLERRKNGTYGIFAKDALKDRVRDGLIKAYGSLTRNLNDFSHVIVAGQQLGNMQCLALLASAGVQGLRQVPPGAGALLSRPAWKAFCRKSAENSRPAGCFNEFEGSVPIILGRPIRAETIVDGDEGDIRDIAQKLKRSPDGVREAMALCFDAARETYSDAGIALFPQPVETLGRFGFSDTSFNRGSVNIRSTVVKGDAHKPTDDDAHMNAAYGAIVIRQVLDQLNDRQ